MALASEFPPPSPKAGTPTPYNATAWQQLSDAISSGQQIEATLVIYEPEGREEQIAWPFLINPNSLEIENAASYGDVAPHATRVSSSQYSHTSGKVFTIPNMMFALWCYDKSAKQLLDGLDDLLEADPENDRFAPPLLRFAWGSYSLGPLSLIRYSYKITAVKDGEPTDVRDLTLVFKEQPRPLTQAEQEERAQARLRQAQEDAAAQGGPKNPLTERQQQEALDRASLYLTENVDRFSADIQTAIRGGEFALVVDPETGLVTMNDADGNRLGLVSQYDGDKHKISQNTMTLPLSEGQTRTDGVIFEDGSVGQPAATTTTTTTPTP